MAKKPEKKPQYEVVCDRIPLAEGGFVVRGAKLELDAPTASVYETNGWIKSV